MIFFCFLPALILLGLWPGATGAAQNDTLMGSAPPELPLNAPRQITSEADSVPYAAISADGRWLVYSSRRKGFTDLWRRSADPAEVVLPEQLTDSPANELAPAFSPDGRYLAYTGTGHDVKGDIYLLDLQSQPRAGRRLTGRDTADGFAAFSADGGTLFWHQAQSGKPGRRIAALDLTRLQAGPDRAAEALKPRYVKTDGDAAFPKISPDGRRMAFVSQRNNAGSDIYSLNLKTGELAQWTNGSTVDRFPAFSPDGRYLYFSRIALDTDRDGRLTPADNGVIYRVDLRLAPCDPDGADNPAPGYGASGDCPRAYPLTSAAYTAEQPLATGNGLFFLSTRKGVNNLWALPLDGEIPVLEDAKQQFELAREIADRIPPDAARAIPAYYRVIEHYGNDRALAAQAAHHAGRLYVSLELPAVAVETYKNAAAAYADIQPWAALSQIEALMIDTRTRWDAAIASQAKKRIRNTGLAGLKKLAAGHAGPVIKATANLRQAQLAMALDPDSKSLLAAARRLSRIIEDYPDQRRIAAEAAFERAEAYRRLGLAAETRPAYLTVIDHYPDDGPWADRAVERIVDLSLEAGASADHQRSIELLEQLATDNHTRRPRVAMGALNRIGDLFYAEDNAAPAKSAYRRVMNQYPQATAQTAAARLALAEIFYREERFRKALDLYEREIGRRPYADRIYRLSREGYIRKSIASGEFLYRVGEVAAAGNVFKDLLRYDDTIIEAHRGYIKCAAELGKIPDVLEDYRQRLQSDDGDPIAQYATGLALTYREDKESLLEARTLVTQAIARQGQIEYYHQTRGYILEVLESVHQESGNLALSLEAYRKAYFLNDPRRNPANAANLMLNQGNGYFRLGQYRRAFTFYQQRKESGQPFENPDTEILFYRRLGAAAFQINDNARAISAFNKALDLVTAAIQPRQASSDFDDVSRFIMDRILKPGIHLLKNQGLKKRIPKGEALVKKQSDINRRRFQLTRVAVPPPPDAAWQRYRDSLTVLLAEQSALNRACANWVGRSPRLQSGLQVPGQGSGQQLKATVETIAAFKNRRVEKALEAPQRFTQLRVELLDRIGLAHQESGQWQKAGEIFQRVYDLNERLGLNQNLVRSKRSVAYNAYLRAGRLSGRARETLLQQAAEGFSQVIELVERHGVAPPPSEAPGGALFNITTAIALDKRRATAAQYGFSAVQEKRMAEAFISRIKTELGALAPAYDAVIEQLAAYPSDDALPADKDLYGVSLLHHRAGHLALPLGKTGAAFDHFEHSARLALAMDQVVSSGMNVANMAHLLTRGLEEDALPADADQRLEALDRQVSRLLAQRPAVNTAAFNAVYHNAMGVYALQARRPDESGGAMAAVHRMNRLQRAAGHFSAGLATYASRPPSDAMINREDRYRSAVLHLNMARVAAELGEPQQAATNLKTALEQARQGRLPDLQWRILVRMGRLPEALEVLASVTLLSAAAQPGEILEAFAPMVLSLVEDGEIEEGFNLAEHLAEIERVHRLAPLFVASMDKEEKKLYRRVRRHLVQMAALREKIKTADGEEKAYLTASLDRESELVDARLGKERENLPALAALGENTDRQHQLMILVGLALEVDAAADKLATTTRPDPESEAAYELLLDQYQQILETALYSSEMSDTAEGLIAAFGPKAAEAIDLMEGLPEAGVLTRVLALKGPAARYIAFRLTADDIRAAVVTAPELAEMLQRPAQVHFVAHENPADLPRNLLSEKSAVSYVLSGTHLHRSLLNRKPFKRTLLAMPHEYAVTAQGYDLVKIADTGSEADLLAAVPRAHTLLAGGRSGIVHTVPTRAGETAGALPALETDRDGILPLGRLTGRLANTSLTLLPGASIEQGYALGHLFSLLGCPSIILPLKPVQEKAPFIRQFLQHYPDHSAADALDMAQDATGTTNAWIQIGTPGMNPEEANRFAQEHFVDYVRKGQAAFNDGRAREALAYFENGTRIALESDAYKQYLPDLYRYSRESAYRAQDDAKALAAAKALSELLATTAPDSGQHAEALLRFGLLQARLEQYDQALPPLEESLEIIANLEDPLRELNTLSAIGTVLENATDYDQALDKFTSAARLGRELDKKELLARQYKNLGRINDLRLSRYARAKQDYTRAMNLYREQGNTGLESRLRVDVGRCERLLGNFTAADAQYRKAWESIQTDTDADTPLQSRILIEQANNAWFQARYQEAFDLQRQALELARRNDWALGQVIALNTSGLIWWTLADYPRALRDLEQALALAEKLESRQDEVASTLNNIGLIHRDTRRYPEALAAFERALKIDRKLKSRWAVSYDLRNMGLTYYQMGVYEKALPLFETAAEEAGAIGNRINQAKALLGLGRTLSALGQETKAVETLTRALDLARGMALRETQWRALYALAQIKRKAGTRTEARELLLRAVEVIEGMRADLKIDQLKEGFIENKTAVYETLVSLLVEEGETVRAFDVAERSRARNFIDLLGNQRINLHGAVAQAQYDRLLRIKARINEQEALLAQAIEPNERTAYTDALDQLKDDQRDLLLEIQLKNPQLSTLVTVNPLKLADIRSLLEPDVAVMAYYTVPREILCWLVTKDGVELFRTPTGRDTLEAAVTEYRRMIQNLEPLEQQSRQLFEWLVAPAADRLKGNRYVGIIPHGPLHYLSFATLSQGNRYLIDDYPLFYLPSASVFKHTLARRSPEKNVRVLAIGNPSLDNPALELPFSEREVESIKWNFPDITILTRKLATESWVKKHIGEFGIIHLASHGEFDPVNPLFSAVKLRKDAAADGDLEAAEVFGMDIKADLVVLSACQTGIGRVSGGDEVVGLNRAYFYAGTHAIVSSLWRVSDISTAVLMKQFYRRYIGSNKSDGLRQAVLHVKNRYPHPGYWGAFTLVGDYE